MNTLPLYVYWEGPRKAYYDCCIDTIFRHNPDTTIVDRAMAESIIGPYPMAVESAYIAQRSDWVRKRLVLETGGMYVDADFICFRPLDSIRQLARDFDYVGVREWGASWMDNFFAARKGSPVVAAAADYALDQLERHGGNVAWLATNQHAVCHALAIHPWKMWLEIPTHLVTPVCVMETAWFTDETPIDVRAASCFGYMTSCHALGGWGAKKSKAEILTSPTRIGQLLRAAIV